MTDCFYESFQDFVIANRAILSTLRIALEKDCLFVEIGTENSEVKRFIINGSHIKDINTPVLIPNT